jgi:hypothetical protein
MRRSLPPSPRAAAVPVAPVPPVPPAAPGVPLPPESDQAEQSLVIPPYQPGARYLEHTEQMVLTLFADARKLAFDPDRGTSPYQRIEALATGVELCRLMQSLAYPPESEEEGAPWVEPEEEPESDSDGRGRRCRTRG